VLRGARLAPGEEPVDIVVIDGVVTAVMAASSTPSSAHGGEDLGGALVVPGFVDLHNHGGGGTAIYTGQREDILGAADFHLRQGTTTMLASVAAMGLEEMTDAVAAIASVVDHGLAPNIRGIHCEGPFLSPHRVGAQSAAALLPPSEEAFGQLQAAAGGHLVQMTIAPELPGSLDLIAHHHREVLFSLGHSAATTMEAAAGFDAGIRQATHLFNAMPAFDHRRPGAAIRALLDERVVVEVIGDGIHLANDTLRLAFQAAGKRVAVVTDSNAAAGMPPGHYEYADRVVDVDESMRATVTGTGTLAGSTMPLGQAFRRLVHEVGVPLPQATRATSATAADQLGLTRRGRIAPGALADLAILDDDLNVSDVILHGRKINRR
jgi:N-acetylglucosamine-6-phosphate deacetylase